jgi:hypothetical protein
MHLAGRIMTQLIDSIDLQEFQELFPTLKKDRVVSIARMGGLLHDLGHGPFSHSSEKTMLRALKKRHPNEIEEAKKVLIEENEEKLHVHEYFSYKLITNSSELTELLEEEIGAENVGALITKIKDVKAEVAQNPNGLLVLRKIVSSQLDADRMDYITRDAAWAGVSYGSIDTERVIGNMALRKVNNDYDLVIHERALNAIESIVDSRFKMYKWVYNHHMVVATEELAQKLVEWICNSDQDFCNKLHWSSFQQGELSDVEVESALRSKLISKTENAIKFKGFLDRRYLPVSLLKRRKDLEGLYDDIEQAMNRKVSDDYIDKMFEALFKNPEEYEKKLKTALSNLPSPADQAVLLPVNKQGSPYKALRGETIWLYSDTSDRNSVEELIKASTYVERINDEFVAFPSIYISYFIPNKTKVEAKKIATNVRQTIVKVVSEIQV